MSSIREVKFFGFFGREDLPADGVIIPLMLPEDDLLCGLRLPVALSGIWVVLGTVTFVLFASYIEIIYKKLRRLSFKIYDTFRINNKTNWRNWRTNPHLKYMGIVRKVKSIQNLEELLLLLIR